MIITSAIKKIFGLFLMMLPVIVLVFFMYRDYEDAIKTVLIISVWVLSLLILMVVGCNLFFDDDWRK